MADPESSRPVKVFIPHSFHRQITGHLRFVTRKLALRSVIGVSRHRGGHPTPCNQEIDREAREFPSRNEQGEGVLDGFSNRQSLE